MSSDVLKEKNPYLRHQGKTAAEHQRQKGEGEHVLFTKDQADCSILTTTETRTQWNKIFQNKQLFIWS